MEYKNNDVIALLIGIALLVLADSTTSIVLSVLGVCFIVLGVVLFIITRHVYKE